MSISCPCDDMLTLLTWSVPILSRYLTRQCFWMKLCPKAPPCSRLGRGIRPSCELYVIQKVHNPRISLASFAERLRSSAPSCLCIAHSTSWFSAAIRMGLPHPLPAVLGSRVCARTVSESRAEVQLAWVGCRWWEWECALAGGVTLTKAASSAHAQGSAEQCWERRAAWVAFLASSRDVQRALGRSGWDEVTSSVPRQYGSDEHLPSQGMRSQHPERFGGTGGSWCVVILWGASSLCSDLFFTPTTDQSYMLVYPDSRFVPGVSSFSCLNYTFMSDQCEVGYEEKD